MSVSIGPREGGGFGLAVSMGVEDKSLAQRELEARRGGPRQDLSLFARDAWECRRHLRSRWRLGTRGQGCAYRQNVCLGHEQTSRYVRVMSDIFLKADIHQRGACPLSASNRHPENRNEGPIATFISHALLRTIGIRSN